MATLMIWLKASKRKPKLVFAFKIVYGLHSHLPGSQLIDMNCTSMTLAQVAIHCFVLVRN